jgi:hypothetical protein
MLLRTAFSPARNSRRRRFHFQPQPWKKSSFGARTRRPARRTLISRLGALSVQSSRFQSVIQRSATRQPTRCCLCISDCTTPHDLHSPSFPTCTCKRRRAATNLLSELRSFAHVDCVACTRAANAELSVLLRPHVAITAPPAASSSVFHMFIRNHRRCAASTNSPPAAALRAPRELTALG